MLGVILNEENIIKGILDSKKSKTGVGRNVSLMIKHYYIKESITDKLELKEKIFSLLKDKYDGYKRGKWEATVDRSVNIFLKNVRFKKEDKVKKEDFFPNKEFVKIDKIEIYNKELQCIRDLDDKNLEKISFIMLVYAKITNIVLKEEINWVGQSISNILKEAKVGLKGTDKELLLHRLYNKYLGVIRIVDEETGEVEDTDINYISMPKSNSKNSFKLNYADTVDEVGEVGIVITDFNSVIYSYLIWKGEKWKQCENIKQDKSICSKWFKIKNIKNTSQKYCANCKKDKERLWDKENKAKNRICHSEHINPQT